MIVCELCGSNKNVKIIPEDETEETLEQTICQSCLDDEFEERCEEIEKMSDSDVKDLSICTAIMLRQWFEDNTEE